MKKVLTLVLAAAILFCGAAMMKGSFEASAKISPTAATITINPDATTVPTETYTGGTATATATSGTATSPSSGTGTATATKPTSGSQTAAPTTPDGSTITGTAKPDENPESPKTGGMSSAVFAFAGIVFAGAAMTVAVGKKNKEND